MIGLLLVTVFFFASACKTVEDEGETGNPDSGKIGQYIGDFIQSFIETDSRGNSFSLEDLKGRVILLNISAMWCGPCRNEASELMEIYNTYKERGFEIVQCIYQDEEGDPADISDIQRWVNEFDLGFTVVNDPDKSLTGFFSFSGIPFNVIIGRDFVIRYRSEGFFKSEIIRKIEELL